MNKLVVIGSSNTDMVIKTNRLPMPGETVMGGKFLMNPGGKGANQAVAAVRLGIDTVFISKTGNDLFGQQAKELYESEGINTAYVFTDSHQPSGVALISVDDNGENCIVVAPGANMSLDKDDLKHAEAEIAACNIMLLQLEIPIETVEYAVDLACKYGIKVVLNPAPAQLLPDSLMAKLHVITPNRTEAGILSGIEVVDWESAEAAACEIQRKGVDIVVITLGSKGALIREKDSFHRVPAVQVDVVDTTAAGDVFNGALCVAMNEGRSMRDAVEFACRCAAISTTRIGAQSSIPHRAEL